MSYIPNDQIGSLENRLRNATNRADANYRDLLVARNQRDGAISRANGLEEQVRHLQDRLAELEKLAEPLASYSLVDGDGHVWILSARGYWICSSDERWTESHEDTCGGAFEGLEDAVRIIEKFGSRY